MIHVVPKIDRHQLPSHFSIRAALDEIKFYPYPPKIQQRLDCLKEMNAKVTEKYLIDQKSTYIVCRVPVLSLSL